MIKRFLTAVAAGRDGSHPDDGLYVQPNALANPSTAQYYGLTGRQSGVLVVHVAQGSPFAGRLARGDVLTAIDGHAIGADGRVTFRGERVDFKVYYDLRQIGESVTFSVQRAGKETEVEVKAAVAGDRYTPGRIFPDHLDYLVYGGLVFETMSRNYLETFGDDWWDHAPLEDRFLHRFWDFAKVSPDATAPVVLAARLPHEVNAYVDVPVGSVVSKVDGKGVKSLSQMRTLLSQASDDLVVIEFEGSASEAVLSRRDVLATSDAIAQTYRVEPASWLTDSPAEGAE
jgi:PDZ domain